MTDLLEVRLVDLPVAMHQQAAQHLDELQRELTYIASEPGSVPVRLRELSRHITTTFADSLAGPREVVEAAVREDRATIELVYHLPVEAREAAMMATAMLDEVQQYCVDGGLLTLAMGEELLAYRRWFFGEFVEQLAGAAPTSWPEWHRAHR